MLDNQVGFIGAGQGRAGHFEAGMSDGRQHTVQHGSCQTAMPVARQAAAMSTDQHILKSQGQVPVHVISSSAAALAVCTECVEASVQASNWLLSTPSAHIAVSHD